MNDILLNDSGEVLVANGDLLVGYSNQQHQKHLILFEKGALKENLTVGVGAFRYLESETQSEFLREVSVQFTGDGLKVDRLSIGANGNLNIDADYNK